MARITITCMVLLVFIGLAHAENVTVQEFPQVTKTLPEDLNVGWVSRKEP